MTKAKLIWLAWEIHQRTKSIAQKLRVPLFDMERKGNRVLRYSRLSIRTWQLFWKHRPTVLIVQNPSMILSINGILYGKILRYPIIVDSHNAGIEFEHPNKLIQKVGQLINHFIIANAYLTIVTNHTLSELVIKMNGTPFILPDPFPEYPIEWQSQKLLSGCINVFYICTFSADEPFNEFFEAIGLLPKEIHFHLSGKIPKSFSPDNLASNIFLTGYLPQDDYVRYLHSVDVIVDLTYRENCLLCGAYEAVSANTALVLSDTEALRSYFQGAALYTANNPFDIAETIQKALEQKEELKKHALELKRKRDAEWDRFRSQLENIISALLTSQSIGNRKR